MTYDEVMKNLNPRFNQLLLSVLIVVGVLAPQLAWSHQPEGAFKKVGILGTTYISTEELDTLFDELEIIDVRSEYEYNVIHIKGAHHVPVAHINFLQQLREITRDQHDAKLLFYCNGIDCGKSERAGRMAQNDGYTNVFVYGPGVLEWTSYYPDRSVFFGASPVPSGAVISDDRFSEHLLSPDQFKEQLNGDPQAFLIDLRDAIQKEQAIELGQKSSNLYLDRLTKLLAMVYFRQHTLGKRFYIYDNVGRQVRWLQYYLNRFGYKDYHFLQGGATAYLKQQERK